MMKRIALIVTLVCLATASATAGTPLSPYSQDFEGLDMSNPDALTNDGWLVFGNVFDSGGAPKFGYGPFGAPNGGPAFSAIVTGQGGPPQGDQQLSIYNDYNCCMPDDGHFNMTDLVESNVFQERTIGAANIGQTWSFNYDAKIGNLEGNTTALAFIKTLDPNDGFALTNFIMQDMTGTPDTWTPYQLNLGIDDTLEGQIIQFGFASTASNFEGSGVFYDNINIVPEPATASFAILGLLSLLGLRRRR